MINAKLRAAAKRTVTELEDYLGDMFQHLGAERLPHFFYHCGYRVAQSFRELL